MRPRLTVFLVDEVGRTIACAPVETTCPGDGCLVAAHAFVARVHLEAPAVRLYVHWPTVNVGQSYDVAVDAMPVGSTVEVALAGAPLLRFPAATEVPCAVVEGDARVTPATGGAVARVM